jgi:predicted permease
MHTLWQDVRFGVRTLLKSPVFTLAAVVSLALGIGVNTTIFTLVNAVFLNPLPVARPAELVAVYTTDERNTVFGVTLNPVSFPNYEDYRDRNDVLSGMAAYTPAFAVGVALGDEPQQAFVEMVTGNYFEVLGVKPAIGRFFLPEEDRTPGAAPVAVLSHGFWQRRFGGDPSVPGRTFALNGTPFTVIGVAPDGFRGINAILSPDLWVPTMMHQVVLPAQFADAMTERRGLFFNVAGRLKPNVTTAQAEAQLQTISRALEQEYPEPNKARHAAVRPITEATVFPGLRGALVTGSAVLMGVVGLVLLIACSNVANLLLARAAARRQEIAVRLALGAGRLRLVRQLLTESLMLGLAGGGLGLLVAYWGRNAIWSNRPPFVGQNLIEPQLDARVLFFTLVVAIVTGALFGLVPAFRASRPDLVDALKEETRTAGRSRRGVSLANSLVVGQVALSLVALIAAGLFVRSIQSAYGIDPGFDTRHVALFVVNPAQAGYDRGRTTQFYREARERIESTAGVERVAWASNLPLFGGFFRSVFIEGREQDSENSGILTLTNNVGPGYFAVMDIAIRQGRDFTTADREGSQPVAIVNETMARRYWPNERAIGRRFRLYGDTTYREVVGVVETVKSVTLGETPQPCIYLPLDQNFVDAAVLHVRAAGEPSGIIGTVRGELRALDARLPIVNTWTVGDIIDQSLWPAKLAASLLAVFGALALVLASVGLYGIMAYAVSRRQREIGLRMALGAQQSAVLRMVLRQGMTLVGVGTAVGLAGAVGASRALGSLLYGSPLDLLSFGGAVVALLAVALVASFLPALRASRVDPLVARREG